MTPDCLDLERNFLEMQGLLAGLAYVLFPSTPAWSGLVL